ncbi:hypothetical protein O185_12815 [Photorhabdus temperata J3]|uniref:Uncharacterized protein n=1 Tax=Photorhabdus temperata J3 TaxID=1389415 RepID=U7QZZ8_PHOTE|nr:hypothetical protein O185_12815 [Photorhabdus temperata J3]
MKDKTTKTIKKTKNKILYQIKLKFKKYNKIDIKAAIIT